MHQETRPGEATPSEGETIVGTQVDFEKIAASANEGEEKIYKYVQEPLRKWLANFDTVVVWRLACAFQHRFMCSAHRCSSVTRSTILVKHVAWPCPVHAHPCP